MGVPRFLRLVFDRQDVRGWLVVSLRFVKRGDLTSKKAKHRFARRPDQVRRGDRPDIAEVMAKCLK